MHPYAMTLAATSNQVGIARAIALSLLCSR
jgi:hypothetical protein